MFKNKIQYAITYLLSNLIHKKNCILKQNYKTKKILVENEVDEISLFDASFNQKVTHEIIDAVNNLRIELDIPSIQVSICTKEHGDFNVVSGFANLETKKLQH